MKSLMYVVGFFIIGVVGYFMAYDPIKVYNRAGQVFKPIKIWCDTVAITNATPSVNISSAGFSTILNVQPQILQTSVSTANFTWCNLTSYTNTAVNLFLTQQNNNTVNILGSLVLLGTPLQAPTTFSNMSVVLTVTGY